MQHHKKVPQGRLSQGLQPQKPPPQKNAPLSAAVESDVVGYTTISMQAGKWYQIGNPFVELENGVTPTVNTVFNTGFSNGDLLYLYDSNSSGYTVTLTWGTIRGVSGWYYGNGNLASDTLKEGQAAFIKKVTASPVTLKGKVAVTEVSFGLEEKASWSQVVCVYPTTQKINDIAWHNLMKNDEVYIYDPNQGGYTTTLSWQTLNGKTGWYYGNGAFADIEVSPGQALFIHRASAGTASCSATVQ